MTAVALWVGLSLGFVLGAMWAEVSAAEPIFPGKIFWVDRPGDRPPVGLAADPPWYRPQRIPCPGLVEAMRPAKKVTQPGKNVAQVGTIAPRMGSRSIVLPTPPTVNHAYATVNGRRVLSKEGKLYKAVVQGLLARAGWVPFEGPVAWTLEWRRERKAGDLSNRFKLVEDAMKGYAWGDDSQVVELRATRRDDPDHAGVTFTVEPR